MIASVEGYIKELEAVQGELPGFRDFLEYTDVLCQVLEGPYGSGGQISSRQIVALAYATYKLILHRKMKNDRCCPDHGSRMFPTANPDVWWCNDCQMMWKHWR